jgi:hypothetical protein
MISSRASMANPVNLNDTRRNGQVETNRQHSCKCPRNSIHPDIFDSVDSQKVRFGMPDQ